LCRTIEVVPGRVKSVQQLWSVEKNIVLGENILVTEHHILKN
jgi:hypothetical protein